MANLTKRDLVARVSNETGMPQRDVNKVLQRALTYITDALADGQGVELRNFGTFEARVTGARVGRNPKSPGKPISIPPKASVRFKMGKALGDKVACLLHTAKLEADGNRNGGNGA